MRRSGARSCVRKPNHRSRFFEFSGHLSTHSIDELLVRSDSFGDGLHSGIDTLCDNFELTPHFQGAAICGLAGRPRDEPTDVIIVHGTSSIIPWSDGVARLPSKRRLIAGSPGGAAEFATCGTTRGTSRLCGIGTGLIPPISNPTDSLTREVDFLAVTPTSSERRIRGHLSDDGRRSCCRRSPYRYRSRSAGSIYGICRELRREE